MPSQSKTASYLLFFCAHRSFAAPQHEWMRDARDAGASDWRTWADVTVPSSSSSIHPSIHELLESGPCIHEDLPSAYPLLIIASDLVSALQGLNSSRGTKAFALIEERRWERAASCQPQRAPQNQTNGAFIFTEDKRERERKREKNLESPRQFGHQLKNGVKTRRVCGYPCCNIADQRVSHTCRTRRWVTE